MGRVAQQGSDIKSHLVSQVEENAGLDVIRKRYHKLALQLHPDKNKHPKAETAFPRLKLPSSVSHRHMFVFLTMPKEEPLTCEERKTSARTATEFLIPMATLQVIHPHRYPKHGIPRPGQDPAGFCKVSKTSERDLKRKPES
ncbi:hypothetical protein HS088_TW13G01638 [Tripterygium wilfordii]|uniref:J domain-containing protein n=1 Tax=Tripterygium wilfordii TaxID=458696 RepID=A0A7J7CXA1_TRIWF|nr:hypothetical protein HS088_TW13G01638 [Tripterygium wilfordii]